MQYYKCECGKREFWGSGMNPQPCEVCDECGTTMIKKLDGTYVDSMPHDYRQKYDVDTGKPKYRICNRCYGKEN